VSQTLVTFLWEGENWAFDLADVVEVVGTRHVTPLPGAHPRLLGIVTWRGRTLPVFAPGALKDSPVPPDLKRRLLVLRRPGPFAVPVDEPGRVVDAAAAERVDLREDGPADGLRLLRVDGRLVRLLDPRAIVATGGAPTDRREGTPGREP
jgi:chemotaxis signal transduction protein